MFVCRFDIELLLQFLTDGLHEVGIQGDCENRHKEVQASRQVILWDFSVAFCCLLCLRPTATVINPCRSCSDDILIQKLFTKCCIRFWLITTKPWSTTQRVLLHLSYQLTCDKMIHYVLGLCTLSYTKTYPSIKSTDSDLVSSRFG